MAQLWRIGVYGLVSGTAGTAAGGLLACLLPAGHRYINGLLLEYSAGLMAAVVCFELLPGAFAYAPLPYILSGMLAGVGVMLASGVLLERQMRGSGVGSARRVGLTIALGVALHNFPEGLAVGSGFEADASMGMALALAILLHDVPEGAAIAVPLRAGGSSRRSALLYTFASGLPMGVGAILGAWAGRISPYFIATCLSVAAGAMLYVVFGDMLPQAHALHGGRAGALAVIFGVLSGFLVTAYL